MQGYDILTRIPFSPRLFTFTSNIMDCVYIYTRSHAVVFFPLLDRAVEGMSRNYKGGEQKSGSDPS